ncbi:BadF/BadG/BcrA/BcrD ATPase family protein [Paenochrobactrum sp. BZR 588]|uniref:BadF/BadG/BcrA/BcrD ATPase family protein n=1 Tax=unclassified Paenochrobactrum TaxID=2639760 RepID=UPI003854287F
MSQFFIGIDGGGTGSRAVVADKSGTILGRGTSGAANIVTDPEQSTKHILEAVHKAFDMAALDTSLYAQSVAILGLAGANIANARDAILSQMPFAHSEIVSDGLIALQGALGDEDGTVIILGTGSAYVTRIGENISWRGGWGFQLSDLGSGARLGRSLLQEVLLSYDCIIPASPLTEHVMAQFGHEPAQLVEFAKTARPSAYAAFAPDIFIHADQGDQVALKVIEQAAADIAQTLRVLIAEGTTQISMLGGLAPLYKKYLPVEQQALIVTPQAEALDGALQLALKKSR